MAPQTHEQNLL